MKILLRAIVVLLLGLLILPLIAKASDNHNTTNYYNTPESQIPYVPVAPASTNTITNNYYNVTGMPYASAALEFDKKEPKLQWSIGAGYHNPAGDYEGSAALAGGIGKRICLFTCQKPVLANLFMSIDEQGGFAAGGAVSGTFK